VATHEINALDAASLSDSTAKGDFIAKKMAIVRKDQSAKLGATTSFATDSTSKIVLSKYSLNELEYSCNNAQAGFAVFSDIYYNDGVKAYIDGKETPIVRTNYILRGLAVPAGAKNIKFVIEPPHMKTMHTVAKSSSYLILLICAALAFLAWKNRNDDTGDTTIETLA
jgi:uncharacterized membrane protein YfhO